MNAQESDIEVDENGTLDLSMKKTKRDGVQASDPPSSSSSSSQPTAATLSQGHSQPEWEEPLDFTTQSGVKEEEHEEVAHSHLFILTFLQVSVHRRPPVRSGFCGSPPASGDTKVQVLHL